MGVPTAQWDTSTGPLLQDTSATPSGWDSHLGAQIKAVFKGPVESSLGRGTFKLVFEGSGSHTLHLWGRPTRAQPDQLSSLALRTLLRTLLHTCARRMGRPGQEHRRSDEDAELAEGDQLGRKEQEVACWSLVGSSTPPGPVTGRNWAGFGVTNLDRLMVSGSARYAYIAAKSYGHMTQAYVAQLLSESRSLPHRTPHSKTSSNHSTTSQSCSYFGLGPQCGLGILYVLETSGNHQFCWSVSLREKQWVDEPEKKTRKLVFQRSMPSGSMLNPPSHPNGARI